MLSGVSRLGGASLLVARPAPAARETRRAGCFSGRLAWPWQWGRASPSDARPVRVSRDFRRVGEPLRRCTELSGKAGASLPSAHPAPRAIPAPRGRAKEHGGQVDGREAGLSRGAGAGALTAAHLGR